MAELIIGVQAVQREKKKLPKGKTHMYITPGWDESKPVPRKKRPITDSQRKARRLQRA